MTVTLAIIITVFAGLPAAVFSAAFFWWPAYGTPEEADGPTLIRWAFVGDVAAALCCLIAAAWASVP